jgi:DGQHR domain-containing protein
MAPRKKSRKKVLTSQQKEQRKLKNDIRSALKPMGFEYLRTEGKHKSFGGRKGEIDSIYLYENIILVCEDTTDSDLPNHVKGKHIFFDEIKNNKSEFIDWIKKDYAEKVGTFSNYGTARYKVFFMYFSTKTVDEDTRDYYSDINFISTNDLNYFKKTAQCLKFTARNELFRFLGIGLNEVGSTSSTNGDKNIDTAVILPEETSGFPEGIKIVSFLMCAEDLMDCAYVLRKEDWEARMQLYQRLISPTRINDIRRFIANNERTFVNNVIVSLPKEVEFYRKDKNGGKIPVDQDELSDIETLMLRIPKKINSICVIDGQHRIFAHYRANDKLESKIESIRKKRHLLVTGLLFPKDTKKEERIKFESEIFLQINSNQKKVNTALLQHIESIQDPYSPTGIARKVLSSLNQRDPFLDLMQFYSFETKKIKTPSIIKWGLRDLVEISDTKTTLFKYWDYEKKDILLPTEVGNEDEEAFEEVFNAYVKFCSISISQFFNAVRTNFSDMWILDKNSKLLGVTAITGFLISFRMSIDIYEEVHDFDFYRNKFSQLDVDFTKGKFDYVSSHWHRFAEEIKDQCWN